MTLTTPARRAEMVREWQAQRLVWLTIRGKAQGEIRFLDDLIEKFGEVSDGKAE